MTKTEEKNGEIYTYDFIRSIEQKIENKVKNERTETKVHYSNKEDRTLNLFLPLL
ncbi:hypothetical protein GCM10008986_25790 [Salinibacillus aidingensis]|uniref:Uncharacterized protein n=1 Tax=Salinibacillus aidingensis TaxID=237684 RepID=A0ABP3LDS3_9BACI